MTRAVAWAALILPFAAFAAPVPAHLMPQTRIELRHKDSEHPLGNSYEVILRNTGSADLQVWTDRPYGLAAFLDFEILNAKGERISRFDPWSMPPGNDAPVRLRETVPALKQRSFSLAPFAAVDDRSLLPGKHRVRVRFRYKDHDATSNWVEVDVTEADVRTKNLVLGP